MTNSKDSAVIAATELKNNTFEALNEYVKESIKEADDPLIAAFALGMASRSFSKEEYEEALNNVVAKYPADGNIQYLKEPV